MASPPPSPLKRLEQLAKHLLARLAAYLFWRPGRARSRVSVPSPLRSVLLVRVDNRVGEALLTTPLFSALKALRPAPRVDLLTHPRTRAVLEGHPSLDAVFSLDRRAAWAGPFSGVMRRLRATSYDLVINCANWSAPSVTSALTSRLAAPRALLIGPATPPVAALHDIAIWPRPDTASEPLQRLHFLSPILGLAQEARLSFRVPRPGAQVSALLEQLRGAPYGVVNPGGRLGWRRVPPGAFEAAARVLAAKGILPVITWGPGEESLAAGIADAVPGALNAPATTIDELAALMGGARLTVCNNTGPMHLAVALGCPTLAFFIHMDIERWGHAYSPHRMVDLTDDIGREGVIYRRAAEQVDLYLDHLLEKFPGQVRR